MKMQSLIYNLLKGTANRAYALDDTIIMFSDLSFPLFFFFRNVIFLA